VALPPWQYHDRWALVTGASAGIGEVFARRLAERGMHLVLSARREDRLRALARHLRAAHGVRAEIVPLDLAEPGAPVRLWRQAAHGREIHLLVNNAGFGAQGRFDQLPLQRQSDMVRLNCTALLELTRLALPDMRARGAGAVINVSSIAAFQPIPDLATYAATKAFVLSLSQALWTESREAGVRVLALCPGRTPTEFQAVAGTGAAEGTFGVRTPEQVVAAALRALERGDSYVVPGTENHLASWLVRLLPHSTVGRVLRRLVRRAARRR
jgi:short-subunit dehydrogenase